MTPRLDMAPTRSPRGLNRFPPADPGSPHIRDQEAQEGLRISHYAPSSGKLTAAGTTHKRETACPMNPSEGLNPMFNRHKLRIIDLLRGRTPGRTASLLAETPSS
ncbi:hypothetical protein GCM10019017_06450 [Streptomyces showdoensis]